MSYSSVFCKAAMLFGFAFVLSGCTLVDIQKEVVYDYRGHPITEQLIGQIQPGKTTQEWVLNNFGFPSHQADLSKTKSQFIYIVEERVKKSTKVFLIFRTRSETIEPRQISIMFDRKIVQYVNSWLRKESVPPKNLVADKPGSQPAADEQKVSPEDSPPVVEDKAPSSKNTN